MRPRVVGHSDERCGSWDGADVGWLVRSEGGWAARVHGDAHLMWVCSFSGLVLGGDSPGASASTTMELQSLQYHIGTRLVE